MAKTSRELLKKYSKMDNIAEVLEDKVDDNGQSLLLEIAMDVISEFEDDLASRKEWEDLTDEGIKLSKLTYEEKDFPWPGASNLKHPITAISNINFAAYTFPEIIRNDKVLEVEVIGFDYDGKKADLASRLTQFGNYQLLCEDMDWCELFDKLCNMLPAQGDVYEKVYWDPIKERIISEICGYKEIIVNHNVKSFDSARRVSHLMVKHQNEIVSKIRQGLFSEVELEELEHGKDSSSRETEYSEYLESNEYEVIEQHKWLDLDDDGFEEPYIVTVLSESKQVLRIAPRYDFEDIKWKDDKVIDIKPVDIFVPYHYIPSPDGCYHSLSLSVLLLPFNKGINAVLNQLINAGTLATTQGGFFTRGARLRGGKIYLEPGEWIKCDSADDIDLNKAIVPLEYKEPSSVLANLLEFLVSSAKEISSISDVMTGSQNAQNVQATTIQILAEKGLKVFSAVQRRIQTSLDKRFKIQFALNKKYISLDKYKKVLDYMEPVSLEDFDTEDFNVKPVANPNLSSDIQRQARSQMEMGLLQFPIYQSSPQAQVAIIQGFLESNNSVNIQQKLPNLNQPKPPNPEAIKVQGELQEKAGKLDLENRKHQDDHQLKVAQFQQDSQKQQAEIKKILAEAQKTMSDAQSSGQSADLERHKQQLEVYKAQMEGRNHMLDHQATMQENQHNMQMNQQELHNDQIDREHKLAIQQQQHQQNMQQQAQQHQQSMQSQQEAQQAQQALQAMNLDSQYNIQGMQQQADSQNQQLQTGADLYKHNTGLQAQQQQQQNQFNQDRLMNTQQQQAEHQNNKEQRNHEKSLEESRAKQAAKRPNTTMGRGPSQ